MSEESTVLTANDNTAADTTGNEDAGMVDAKDLGNSEAENNNDAFADALDLDKANQDTDDKASDEGDKDKSDEDGEKSDVPESYDLKLGDDSLLTAESVAKISEIAKEQNFTQEQAEAALNIADSQVAAFKEGIQTKSNELGEQWREQCLNDSEFGGEAFGANVKLAGRAMDKFASPEFKSLLGQNGFGNNPEIVRTFVRIGKAMSEDSFENGEKGGNQTLDQASKLYPDQPKS